MKVSLIVIVCGIGLCVIASCTHGPASTRPGGARAPTAHADFTILPNDPAGPALVGFGGEMNPYLYCKPNWGDVTEQNVRDLEQKVIALRPQHVRIFFLLEWWTPEGDPLIAKGDPRAKESFLRVCRLAQRAGATINVTLWYGKLYEDPEAAGRRFAAVMKDLLTNYDLHAIKYVTMQNEVNLHPNIKMEPYNRLYRAFDAAMKELGVRDRIQVVGGDLVQNSQEAWLKNLAENQGEVLDGYGFHIYWDYWDTQKMIRRIAEVQNFAGALPPDGRKPLYVMEFGVRGIRPEPKVEPGTDLEGTPIADTTLAASQIGWFMMEALNRGFVATVQWEIYDAWYDRYMPYGVIGGAKLGYPRKPGYDLLRLFTHTLQPGWRAMKVIPNEGTLSGRLVSAVAGPDGKWTVYILNAAEGRQEVSIATPFKGGTSLSACSWNESARGRLGRRKSVEVRADGTLRLALAPRSLVALTTFEPDLDVR